MTSAKLASTDFDHTHVFRGKRSCTDHDFIKVELLITRTLLDFFSAFGFLSVCLSFT